MVLELYRWLETLAPRWRHQCACFLLRLGRVAPVNRLVLLFRYAVNLAVFSRAWG